MGLTLGRPPTSGAQDGCHGNTGFLATGRRNLHFMIECMDGADVTRRDVTFRSRHGAGHGGDRGSDIHKTDIVFAQRYHRYSGSLFSVCLCETNKLWRWRWRRTDRPICAHYVQTFPLSALRKSQSCSALRPPTWAQFHINGHIVPHTGPVSTVGWCLAEGRWIGDQRRPCLWAG